ncbi:MAG TPA: alpha/beta hydrolase [Planctomycetota bacterium]|nr:alpha/beta hydrolase [Planctomycetota bacterium]
MIPLKVTTRNDRGPALLLIHGFPLDHRIWTPQLERLPSSIRIVAPDLRGCGSSPLPPGPCTIDDYARDLLTLMNEQKADRFYVAGHSMGGYIVFSMLRQAPNRILGAALVSSRALPDSDDVRKTRETVAERAEKEGPGFLAESMPARAVGETPPPGVLDRLRTIMGEAQPAGVAAAARAMAARIDSTPGLARIACPTVVFAGRQDKIVPPAESEAMAKAIPGARLVWCERSGHVPMLEESDLVTRELASLAR